MEGRLSPHPDFLFPRLIGAAFDGLPGPVRRIHQRAGCARYAGEVEVDRGRGLLSRLFAAATRLPPAGRGPVRVEIESNAGGERWTRHIGGRAMPSRMRHVDGLLREQLGLVRFDFELCVIDGGIQWRVVRVSALGLPLPARWFAGVGARESEAAGRYHFDVWARMPGVGLLVHYRGWLE